MNEKDDARNSDHCETVSEQQAKPACPVCGGDWSGHSIQLSLPRALRLAQVAGDLGEKIIRRHTDLRDQPQLVADAPLDPPSDLDRGVEYVHVDVHDHVLLISRPLNDRRPGHRLRVQAA